MKIITILIIFSLAIIAPALSRQGENITGTVMDSETHTPLQNAHVYLLNSNIGTATNSNGHFRITASTDHHTLVISHVGYRDSFITILSTEINQPLIIHLEPVSLRSEDIIITTGRAQMRFSGIYSDMKTRTVEDHMASISGLDMVTRANFAKDPVIRGLRDSRVNVLIDGMRLTPACVDGMDPATAYVEADNLQSIEISRGQEAYPLASTASGGSINFAMARPVLKTGLTGSVESGFSSVSNQQISQAALAYGSEKFAVRVSGTYRNAGDLRAGNGVRIEDSGLEKGNFFTSILFKPSEDHQFNARYIGDFAGKIGYPMLIMDTRRADAHIAGVEYSWKNPSSIINSITTNVYLNRVEHWMDDYDRDVSRRDVMRDMYMPMYGKTQTAGITSELNAIKKSHLINIKLEAFSIDAFAEMLMEHVNPGVSDMYLVNLGDVTQRNASISGSYRYFSDNGWILGGNTQFEIGTNKIRERSAVATFRAEYPDIKNMEPADFSWLIGISVEKQFSPRIQSGIRLSDGQRLPGHLERYGYYIYQPLDGFFYYGNPALQTERSSQAELFFTFGNDQTRWSANTSFWVNRMDNYITGNRIDELFKQYKNMGSAILTGFEADLNAQLNHRWNSGASVTYVFGQHKNLGEPLPMIPPLKGLFFIQRESDFISFETRLRWSAAQNRIAEHNSLETRTGGYALWDIYARTNITQSLSIQAGAENILNIFYTDHLSVNSMPGAGRNLQVSMKYSF